MKIWFWFQLISFQVIWLASVLGGNRWLFIAAAILCIHFTLTPSRLNDFKILPLSMIGFSIDMAFTQAGIFSFNEWPLWLLVLWIAFPLNLNHSLKFLSKLNIIWIILIGAIGGTYAYWASWKLGAVEFPLGPMITLPLVAAAWAFILPILVKGDIFIRRQKYE